MIHVYNIKDMFFAIDTNSGLVHAVDEIIYELLLDEIFKDKNKLIKLYDKYGEETVKEAISEINYLIDNNMLYTKDSVLVNKIKPAIKAMCLHDPWL